MNNATPHRHTHPLFRSQVLEHISTKKYGTVILVRSISHRWLTLLSALIAVTIVAFFFFFSTTRKAQGQGVLLPTTGVIRILPTQSGVITEKLVREGQLVQAGDTLFVLSNERSSVNFDNAQKIISKLLESRRNSYSTELKQHDVQTQLRVTTAEQRISDMGAEIKTLEAQIDLQQQRVFLSELTLKRFSSLREGNNVSLAELQVKQEELLDQRLRLAELQRLRSVSLREQATAQADIRDLQVQAQQDAAALQRNVSALEQELANNEAHREILIQAPKAGVITAITAEVGQTIAINQPLASVLPVNVQLEAEIYIPSRSVGFIKPGMKVFLRYQAYPYQKFGQYMAHVRDIADTSLDPKELALPGIALPINAATEPLYRIRLKLEKQTVQAYGKALQLKSGMLINASILLEKRRLYEWILEPLFSITGRM
jgi:membrane fusion protein